MFSIQRYQPAIAVQQLTPDKDLTALSITDLREASFQLLENDYTSDICQYDLLYQNITVLEQITDEQLAFTLGHLDKITQTLQNYIEIHGNIEPSEEVKKVKQIINLLFLD